LRTGAAKRKPKAVPMGAPLARSLLATGTFPHSQAGKANPIKAPVIGAISGFLGSRWTQAVWGTSQRASPAIATPSKRKGMASSRRPWKIAQAVESFSKLCGNKVSSPSQVVCEMKSGKASSWIADGSGLDGCLALLGGSRRHLHRPDRL
jgi:hypothetical protein